MKYADLPLCPRFLKLLTATKSARNSHMPKLDVRTVNSFFIISEKWKGILTSRKHENISINICCAKKAKVVKLQAKLHQVFLSVIEF